MPKTCLDDVDRKQRQTAALHAIARMKKGGLISDLKERELIENVGRMK